MSRAGTVWSIHVGRTCCDTARHDDEDRAKRPRRCWSRSSTTRAAGSRTPRVREEEAVSRRAAGGAPRKTSAPDPPANPLQTAYLVSCRRTVPSFAFQQKFLCFRSEIVWLHCARSPDSTAALITLFARASFDKLFCVHLLINLSAESGSVSVSSISSNLPTGSRERLSQAILLVGYLSRVREFQ